MKRVDPRLTGDAAANRDVLARHLAAGPIEVRLPDGRFPLAGGCVLADGQSVRGRDATVLVGADLGTAPLVHVVGSGSGVSDLTIELPTMDTGLHDGDQGTAITVGRYLYPTAPAWIADVEIARVRVLRGHRCAANSIAVMGAVSRVRLTDIDISGGGTGIAVHWGALGESVSTIVGPSYHPHHLTVAALTVRHAFEAFYLSSVHDVSVRDVTADDVEIGFRLLPGDNVDRYHGGSGTSEVSSRIDIADCRIGWRGLYGLRVAGWGRSEVDHQVRRLDYRDVSIRNVLLQAEPGLHRRHDRRRAAVVIDDAVGVAFADIKVGTPADDIAEAVVNGMPAAVDELTG